MTQKRTKSAILAALRAATANEEAAVAFLEQHRWNGQASCPRCRSLDVYAMTSQDGGRNKDYRWRCKACQRMFTVRTETILEESRLPIRVWMYCMWKACASKKGISALQLSREMEITPKSALFLLHRVRHAMSSERFANRKLSGVIEADETFIGGRPRYRATGRRGPRPASETTKMPVFGIVERGGNVRFRAMDRLTAKTLAKAVAEHADTDSRLMTDESSSYTLVGRKFKGGHGTTNHSHYEYVSKTDRTIHSNTIEGAFSLLKRGVYGTFHSVSRKHLAKYLNEFEFRYNARKMNDDERVELAIKRAAGTRLTYAAHLSTKID